jgi:hypothetical protein
MNTKLITTFKEYKEVYPERLKNYLSQYIDYEEIDFIKNEILYFDNCLKNSNVTLQEKIRYTGIDYDRDSYYEYDIENFEYTITNYEVQAIIRPLCLEFDNLGKDSSTNNFDLLLCERLKLSFSKIINFLTNKHIGITENPTKQPIQNKVKFHGNPIEFLELIKSLVENGNLKGTQKDIIENCSNFFDIKINNPDTTIQKIKGRINDSETLFLNKLQITLFNYIKAEKTK